MLCLHKWLFRKKQEKKSHKENSCLIMTMEIKKFPQEFLIHSSAHELSARKNIPFGLEYIHGSIRLDIFCSVLCGCSGRHGQKICPWNKFSMDSSHETALPLHQPAPDWFRNVVQAWLFDSIAGIYRCCSRNLHFFIAAEKKGSSSQRGGHDLRRAVLCGSSCQPSEIKKYDINNKLPHPKGRGIDNKCF